MKRVKKCEHFAHYLSSSIKSDLNFYWHYAPSRVVCEPCSDAESNDNEEYLLTTMVPKQQLEFKLEQATLHAQMHKKIEEMNQLHQMVNNLKSPASESVEDIVENLVENEKDIGNIIRRIMLIYGKEPTLEKQSTQTKKKAAAPVNASDVQLDDKENPQDQQKKKSKKMLILVLILLLIFSIGGLVGGYFIGKSSVSTDTQENNDDSPMIISSPVCPPPTEPSIFNGTITNLTQNMTSNSSLTMSQLVTPTKLLTLDRSQNKTALIDLEQMIETNSIQTQFTPKVVYNYLDHLVLTDGNTMHVFNLTTGIKIMEYTLSVNVWNSDISAVYMTYDQNYIVMGTEGGAIYVLKYLTQNSTLQLDGGVSVSGAVSSLVEVGPNMLMVSDKTFETMYVFKLVEEQHKLFIGGNEVMRYKYQSECGSDMPDHFSQLANGTNLFSGGRYIYRMLDNGNETLLSNLHFTDIQMTLSAQVPNFPNFLLYCDSFGDQGLYNLDTHLSTRIMINQVSCSASNSKLSFTSPTEFMIANPAGIFKFTLNPAFLQFLS